MLKPIFTTAPVASNNDSEFKRGAKVTQNNYLGLLVLILDTPCISKN